MKHLLSGREWVQKLPFREDPGCADALFLTCLQQQLHDGEVGVRHAVVKSRVPVAICHVHKQLQEVRGVGLDPTEVGCHHGRARRLPAGHAEPLLTDGVQALPLKYQQIPIPDHLAWLGLVPSHWEKSAWDTSTAIPSAPSNST